MNEHQFLKNSYERLDWVERTSRQPRDEIRFLESGLAPSSYQSELKVVAETGSTHVRWRANLPNVDPDLTFKIANIAVDLRSCLDMALQEICDHYNVAIKRPQFPVEEPSDGAPTLTPLRTRLPSAFVQVLEHLQPTFTSPLGCSDIPFNQTPLWIRDISNANKHRRVTPVAVIPVARGVRVGGASREGARLLRRQEVSAWPDRDTNSIEIVFPRGSFTNSALENVRPSFAISTWVTKSDHSIKAPGSERRLREVPVYEFLLQGPRYVEFALRCLKQAHTFSSRPATGQPFVHDLDFSF